MQEIKFAAKDCNSAKKNIFPIFYQNGKLGFNCRENPLIQHGKTL